MTNDTDMQRPTYHGVITVDTRPYYTSHLKEPRGRGGWAFAFGADDACAWFAPGSLTYQQARTYAKTRARQLGYTTVFVLP